MIQGLLACGASPHVVDTGTLATPLHYAAATDGGESIVVLLAAGAVR